MTLYALIVDFCESGGNYDGSSESLDAGFGVVGLVFIIVMLVTELYKVLIVLNTTVSNLMSIAA